MQPNIFLRQRIREKFGSQIAFAFHVQEDDAFVSKVVRGWKKLSEEKAAKWAEKLDCDAKDLAAKGLVSKQKGRNVKAFHQSFPDSLDG